LNSGLSHRSGWSGYDGGINAACEERPTNPPGTFFRYSDINFIVLAEVVHRVSGSMLNEFAAHEIYQPLRMEDTGFLPPKSKLDRIAPTERIGNDVLRGKVHDPTARQMGGVAGHAGVFTTTADVARYIRMLLNDGELDGVRLFKPGTVKMMTSVQSPPAVKARRGFGWDIDSDYSRPRGSLFPLGSYGHTGFTGVCLWIDPFSHTFWMFFANRVHPDRSGNVLPLQRTLANLSAEAVTDFDFQHVPDALLPRGTNDPPAH
jgi:CubicO group peptidase (beta-lactamase class C family)